MSEKILFELRINDGGTFDVTESAEWRAYHGLDDEPPAWACDAASFVDIVADRWSQALRRAEVTRREHAKRAQAARAARKDDVQQALDSLQALYRDIYGAHSIENDAQHG
ncbi:MAG: hypothetical protein JW966_09650 [Anaerolineae bacterium]|nr:hypothetical protein [Anaerolineae bacterium]